MRLQAHPCGCCECGCGLASSPHITGDCHIHSEGMREGHREQVVQGAGVKQPNHTLTTSTHNIRLTQRQAPACTCLRGDTHTH